MPTPHVLLGDHARERLKAGIDLLAELVSRTLGPRAGLVAYARSEKQPEALTSSAVIARRIVEISGRGANVGAMLIRHALWQIHERLGDGGATTAALTHALLDGGHRQIAAGANPMLLRRGMEHGLRLALDALHAQARPLDGERQMAGLAQAATGDLELSRALGEIFGRLGPEANVSIEEYAATYTAHQILEGASWGGTFVSPFFIADEHRRETRLHRPRILITDHTIDQPQQLIPLLEQLLNAGGGPLLILAADVTGPARAMLIANRQRGLLDVAAAKLDAPGSQLIDASEDLAVVTNAYVLAKDRSDRLESASLMDLGGAQVAQVGMDKITIVGGLGYSDAIANRRNELRTRLSSAPDEEARKRLVDRLGRLAGGMAVLKIGAASNSERAVRKDLAERFIRFAPQAVEEGVVPGGGAAYLDCQVALAPFAGAGDERAIGVALVREALAAPMTWLARNAGQNPAVVLDQVRRSGAGFGYDVIEERVVEMTAAGILDAAKVVRVALETAVSTAAMALTTEAIVLKRRPIVATTP